jgi:phage I-like protein
MKLFEKLGAKTEAEGFEIAERFTAFMSSIMDLTSEKDPQAAVGKITAWKAAASTDEQRRTDEAGRVEASLASLSGAGDVEKLRSVYASQGFAAFRDAVDAVKAEGAEATKIINGLTETGRLAPSAKGSFENLFKNHGIEALKAAANSLPVKPQISAAPSPSPSPTSVTDPMFGLTDAEMNVCRITGKDPEVYASHKRELAKANALAGGTPGEYQIRHKSPTAQN